MSQIALVLRQQAVELVELRRTFRGVTLAQHVRVPIAGSDDAAAVSAIQSALSAANVRPGSRLGVTVSAQEALLRSFTLPLLPQREWATAVQFEARKYIPFKTEELIWDFHVAEQRSAKELAVVFVGIRKETFAQIQGWLKKAGVRAAFLEAPWFSLARLVGSLPASRPTLPLARQAEDTVKRAGLPKPLDDAFYGIVDLEPHAAHIAIVKDQIPYLARAVTLGPASESVEGANPAEDPRAERLLNELRLSFDFFTGERHWGSISRLWLFGDAATVGPWRAWLATQLSCQIELGILPLRLTRGDVVDRGFAVAVGAALRELRPRGIKLNFTESTPDTTLKARLSPFKLMGWLNNESVQPLVRPIALQATLALMMLAFLALVSHHRVASAQQRSAQVLHDFQDVGWGLAARQRPELAALQQQLDTHVAFLRQIVQQRVPVTDKLNVLATALPDGIWLEGLNYQNPLEGEGLSHSSLTVRGACFLPQGENEFEAIRAFTQRLKEDPHFFQGFTTAQLGEIAQMQTQDQELAYRTFHLDYLSERKAF